jgi:hypothetical protein
MRFVEQAGLSNAPFAPALSRICCHPYARTNDGTDAATVSNVVCSSAFSFTMAPTAQYFSSDSRMASSRASAATSIPLTMW